MWREGRGVWGGMRGSGDGGGVSTLLFYTILYSTVPAVRRAYCTYYGGYRVVIVPSLPLFCSRVLVLSLAAAVALVGWAGS